MDTLVALAGVKRSGDSNVGSNRTPSPSLSGLISTLIPILLMAVGMFCAFVYLRTKDKRAYAPRTYLGSLLEQEKSPALPDSRFGWIPAVNKIPDTFVLQHNSLDSYFLIRYLRIAVIICLVGCCITWPILFPINATGGGGQKQLNVVSFGNVVNKNRYYAHTFICWIFISFVFFMVTRESMYYINVRQAYLLSPLYAARISSRTVLFTSVPTAYANEAKIRQMFGAQLKNVWIPSDIKELSDMVDQRTKAAMKLEGAETKLIKLCNTANLKAAKTAGHEEEGGHAAVEVDGESGSAASRFIKHTDRPTHRLKFLVGKKVDTINWSREEIARLNPLIEAEQAKHRSGEGKPMAAVFVEFKTQSDAQSAFQMVAHHQPLHMAPRVVGLVPEEVVWSNLGITWRTRTIRNLLTNAAVVVTIIFWSIPVAFVGSISNINSLTTVAPFLSFINKCPPAILGIITNLLPVVMLAVLMALLPIYLRFMAKTAGMPTLSAIELRCQESYFWFQVIQVFIVTTLSSAASAAVPTIIHDPSSVTSLLAENLPLAANFYISYFVFQGLTFSASTLLNIVGVILPRILGPLLDSTPRKMYTRWATLSSVGWGTTFPIVELLVVISITYSCIAPLMMGFATVGLWLFYFAFRYSFLYVQTSAVDTKGLVYPKALQHTLVGCYLCVVCLIGLFAIRAAAGPLVLMIIFLIFMVLYHLSLNAAINPLLYYLPRSLEAEEDALLVAEEGTLSGTPDQVKEEKNGASSNDKGVPAPHEKVSMIKKFLRPDIYMDYATVRRLIPRNFDPIIYSSEVERDAYSQPALRDQTPLLWVPRDESGVSRQECMHTSKVTPITDEAARFDDKGKIVWDMEGTAGRPPVYQQKIYY